MRSQHSLLLTFLICLVFFFCFPSIPASNYRKIAAIEQNLSTKWRPKNVSMKWATNRKSPVLPASHNQFVSVSPVRRAPYIPKPTNNGTTNKDHSHSYSGPTLNRSQFVQKKCSLGGENLFSSEKSFVNLYDATMRHVEQLKIESNSAADVNSFLKKNWSSDYSFSDRIKQLPKAINKVNCVLFFVFFFSV